MEKHHQDMLDFVSEKFHQAGDITDTCRPFRNKLSHTRRVMAWVERIARPEGGNEDLLLTCAIFHDVGYTVDPANHPLVSADICDEYLAARGYGEAYRKEARQIILGHGDKSRLKPETPLNELILIEADNLEEKGAMDILWDAMEEGKGENPSYEKTYARIAAHAKKRRTNIMVTPTARRLWQQHADVMELFTRNLAEELALEENL